MTHPARHGGTITVVEDTGAVVYLWLDIILASSAVVAAAGATAYELARRERSITRSWRRTRTRARTTALIAFLVLIIIAQVLLFVSATG